MTQTKSRREATRQKLAGMQPPVQPEVQIAIAQAEDFAARVKAQGQR